MKALTPTRRPALLAAGAAAVLMLVTGCADQPSESAPTLDESASGSTGRLLSATSPDGHKLREVAGAEAPTVRLEVEPDSDSGWNLHLATKRFAFAPERVGEAARAGEGHAHLYLDGKKIARLYGDWYHLTATAVPEGKHTLTVQLNANDHTAWAVDGKPVSAATQITGTGDETGHHQHNATADPTPTEAKADVSVQVAVAGGKVSPRPGRVRVEQGQRVRIQVTSDRADTVHVHGYDLEAEVGPGRPASFLFTADQTGVFEVETHDGGLLLTQLQVQ